LPSRTEKKSTAFRALALRKRAEGAFAGLFEGKKLEPERGGKVAEVIGARSHGEGHRRILFKGRARWPP